jgi:hypothetical protein
MDTYVDTIEQLPYDQSPLTDNEMRIADTLFKEEQNALNKFFTNSKDVLLVATLFVIFSLPQVDEVLVKLIPQVKTSNYIMVGVKTLIFSILFFVMKNIYLVR